MKKQVVYVAGPYRSKTEWGVVSNIRAAEALALEVWQLGMVALCPHKNTAFFGGAADDRVWLEGDLELLRRSDAVILVDGWENSDGSCEEVIAAMDAGIPVFCHINSLAVFKYHGTIIEIQQETTSKAVQCRDARRAKAGA